MLSKNMVKIATTSLTDRYSNRTFGAIFAIKYNNNTHLSKNTEEINFKQLNSSNSPKKQLPQCNQKHVFTVLTQQLAHNRIRIEALVPSPLNYCVAVHWQNTMWAVHYYTCFRTIMYAPQHALLTWPMCYVCCARHTKS